MVTLSDAVFTVPAVGMLAVSAATGGTGSPFTSGTVYNVTVISGNTTYAAGNFTVN